MAVEPKIATARILANFINLPVWYGIAIHIIILYVNRKFW